MPAHGRVGLAGLIVFVAAAGTAGAQRLALLPGQAARMSDDPMTSEVMRSDASLCDVYFTDASRGWAVGDRGAIWHTDDGGAHWHLQRSGVNASLHSVFFLDATTGWAAGRQCHPYLHTSSGIVLLTQDGGKTWSRDEKLLLPGLCRIGFFDSQRGWAIGDSSAMFPSGVFLTENGGRSWKPVPGGGSDGWLAGDFYAPERGAVAGRLSTAAVVRPADFQTATAPAGLRNLLRMSLVPPVYGWLVGQGGLVMMTADRGLTWQTPPAEPPPEMAEWFDFFALAVRGPKAWIAGSPGTRVLHTRDAGQSWTVFSTGQCLPLRALHFVDDHLGWAVGELGLILTTSDGGQTWKEQRSGGRRAALLGLFSRAEDVPLEMLARLCGDEGHLGAVEILNREDVELVCRDEAHPESRLREAIAGAGASCGEIAWAFPMRQAGLRLAPEAITAAWDSPQGTPGADRLESHLVARMRMWRPEIVITHELDPTGRRPVEQIVHQAVLRAVERAADAAAWPEQQAAAGLEPWQVKKIFTARGAASGGPITITSAELAERLGRCLGDITAGPRGLLTARFAPPPEAASFRLVRSSISQSDRADFFAGIGLPSGGDARRPWLQAPAETLNALRRTAQRRRNVEAILEWTRGAEPDVTELRTRLGQLARDLDSETAPPVLFELAQEQYLRGQWTLTAEIFNLLWEDYPRHPLAGVSLAWLVQYYASAEAAWRIARAERPREDQVAGPTVDFTQPQDRTKLATELGRHIERTRPALYAQPRVGFSLAAAFRKQGAAENADRFYLTRRAGLKQDEWRSCALGEQWLANPAQGNPPKAAIGCIVAPERPRLDGRLDEALWQSAPAAELRSPLQDDGSWRAVAMLAYDREHLYLAVHAAKAPGAEYAPAGGPRPRDADLAERDRFELLIDVDRDYTTCYRLAVDHRGWTAEDLWGDTTWNPEWFVAAAADDETWTIEAAIPLEQLDAAAPARGTAWGLGLKRIVPGAGLQSWNSPAAVDVMPEGLGYLLFE